MKFLLIPLVCLSFTCIGQITITADQIPISLDKKIPYTLIKNMGKSFPSEGPDQVWDYSHFVPCDNCSFNVKHETNTDQNAPKSRQLFKGAIYLLGNNLPVTIYYDYKETGDLYEVATKLSSKSFSLKNISGNPLDKISTESTLITSNICHLDVPLEYQKKWTTAHTSEMTFKLTSKFFDIKELPIVQKDSVITNFEVVGYGKLILPYKDKREQKTVTYQALLLEKTSRVYTSFSCSRLPETKLKEILGTVGLDLNVESMCSNYKFYIRETAPFVLSFAKCKNSTQVETVQLRTDLDEILPFPED